MGKKVVIIDVGAVSKYTAFSMMSGGEPVIMATTKQEAIRRFSKLVVAEKQKASADIVIFALDSKPYWRSSYMADWYMQNAKHYTVGGVDMLGYDNAIYRCDTGKKLTMKDLKTLGELGEAKKLGADSELVKQLPIYKGSRVGKPWPLKDLDRGQLHEATMWAVEQLASRMNGLIITIPTWEADDIAAVYAAEIPDYVDKATFVTLDSDWRQLLTCDGRVEVSDIRLGRVYTQDDLLEVKAELRGKIVGGDTSDDISGLPKGANGCYGKDGACDLTKDAMPTIFNAMPELRRNLTLIRLPNPQWADDAGQAVKHYTKRFAELKANVKKMPVSTENYDALYLSEKDLMEIADKAMVKAWLLKLQGNKATVPTLPELRAIADKEKPTLEEIVAPLLKDTEPLLPLNKEELRELVDSVCDDSDSDEDQEQEQMQFDFDRYRKADKHEDLSDDCPF